MSLSQYIREINKASRHGKLVLFVGAGVSTLSGYPRWIELVEAFYDVLEEHKKDQYDSILKQIFNIEKYPNPIHYKILSLNPVPSTRPIPFE